MKGVYLKPCYILEANSTQVSHQPLGEYRKKIFSSWELSFRGSQETSFIRNVERTLWSIVKATPQDGRLDYNTLA